MGNVRNRGRKSARKVLTPEEAENKKEKKREHSRNRRHSLEEQILPIPAQQIPDIEAEENNELLMEVGYRGDDIIGPLLSEQSPEEFNHSVPGDANFTPQQPCQVVQSPNRSFQPQVDVNVTPAFETARNLASKRKRTPKRIQVDESELTSMEGKVAKRTILRHCSQIMKQYFDNKSEAGKCQLFLALFKCRNMATVRRKLGIRTLKNIKSSNHIVKSLAAAFTSIGKKTCSQDCNVARRVLAKSIVSRSTRQRRLLKCTSQIVPLHPKTLKKYSIRRDSLDVEGQMEKLWAFSGRLPRKDMKLVEAVKGLVHTFWHDNTRPSSNTKDVLKHCRGSKHIEPHVKHYLDMTQTQLFEMFKNAHLELRLGQRSFEKCKPWYVRINTIRNTCCCRYHIEFDLYYHTFAHIRRVLHPNHVQECSSTTPPMSSRDFIHSIMCPRQDGQTHYLKQCVEGSCNNCGGLSLWSDCIHESEDQAFGNAIVEKQNYQYETYQLHDGKESRKITLVTSQVIICIVYVVL